QSACLSLGDTLVTIETYAREVEHLLVGSLLGLPIPFLAVIIQSRSLIGRPGRDDLQSPLHRQVRFIRCLRIAHHVEDFSALAIVGYLQMRTTEERGRGYQLVTGAIIRHIQDEAILLSLVEP